MGWCAKDFELMRTKSGSEHLAKPLTRNRFMEKKVALTALTTVEFGSLVQN